MVSELELLFFFQVFTILFSSKGFFFFLQWNSLKAYFLIFYGLLLDSLGSFAEIFVLFHVYGIICNLSKIGLQFMDFEVNF